MTKTTNFEKTVINDMTLSQAQELIASGQTQPEAYIQPIIDNQSYGLCEAGEDITLRGHTELTLIAGADSQDALRPLRDIHNKLVKQRDYEALTELPKVLAKWSKAIAKSAALTKAHEAASETLAINMGIAAATQAKYEAGKKRIEQKVNEVRGLQVKLDSLKLVLRGETDVHLVKILETDIHELETKMARIQGKAEASE